MQYSVLHLHCTVSTVWSYMFSRAKDVSTICIYKQFHLFIHFRLIFRFQSTNFETFKEPKNLFQGTDSARLCSLAGRYDHPIASRFLAPIDCLKIQAQIISRCMLCLLPSKRKYYCPTYSEIKGLA
jgi:hypothetical protein